MSRLRAVRGILSSLSIYCLLTVLGATANATPQLDIDTTRIDFTPPDVIVFTISVAGTASAWPA